MQLGSQSVDQFLVAEQMVIHMAASDADDLNNLDDLEFDLETFTAALGARLAARPDVDADLKQAFRAVCEEVLRRLRTSPIRPKSHQLALLRAAAKLPERGKQKQEQDGIRAQMRAWIAETRDSIYQRDFNERMPGFAAWMAEAGLEGQPRRRMEQLWQALVGIQTDQEPAPAGVSDTVFYWLTVVGAFSLLDDLDEWDPRMAELIICYFTTNTSLDELAAMARVSTGSGALEIIGRGVKRLWNALPEKEDPIPHHPNSQFQLDKAVLFPLDVLRKDRSSTNRLTATRRWRDAAERDRLRTAIRQGRQTEVAHQHMSDAQLRRRVRERATGIPDG